jgi:hypothetical protein
VRGRSSLGMMEFVVVIAIATLLAGISLPGYAVAERKARVSTVLHDFGTIRFAVLDLQSRTHEIPETDSWGHVPADLVAALPDGFRFGNSKTQYRWRAWPLPSGLPGERDRRYLFVLEVRGESALLAAIHDAFPGSSFGSGSDLALVIE